MTAMISDYSPGARGKVTPSVRSVDDEVVRGREGEQKIVRDLLRRAQRGLGGVVLVEGEPGIGKSLLLRDSTDVAAGQGFSLAAGAADQLGRTIPFFALRTAIREPFAELTANSHDRDRPDGLGWLISRVQAHLEQRAAAAPVLVCLDDLQWANPATLAALRTLPRELRRHPVAWVLARSNARQHDVEYLFGLLEKDGAARITLAPLSDDAVAAMLTDAFAAPPDPGLLDLAHGAAGNPSLLAELIRGLREDNAVEVIGGCAVLVSAPLPRRMHPVAQRRLDGLSKRARHLLVTAAVLGPSFRLEDAAEMLGETPAMLLPAVEEAMGAGIMAAAESAFSFRHELLRRAAGEMIPRPARKALHRQYGEILLRRGDSAALTAASHLLQAAHPGDPASLADLDKAATQTLGAAPQTAADLALRALELTPPTDPGALSRSAAAAEALAAAGRLDQAAQIARDMLARPLPPVSEARLRCALSSVLGARGQARDAHAEAKMALAQPQLPQDLRVQAMTAQLQALTGLRDELAGRIADTILAAPSQYDSHAAMAALAARAVLAWDNGQVGEGLELWRDAARRDIGISPDARHAQPLLALAAALIDLRQLDEAEDILRAADTQALHGIPAQAGLSIVQARVGLARGRLADAAAAGREALAAAQALGAHGYADSAHGVLAVIALRSGDLAAAVQHTDSRAPGPHFLGQYRPAETVLVQARLTQARQGPAVVIGHLRRVCADLAARPGLLLGDPTAAAWLVRVALAAGDTGLAAAIATAAEALATANPGYSALTAAAAHSQGLLGQDLARLAQATSQHPDPWARASATEDLAVLHLANGDRDQAIGHLTQAIGGYQQVGAATDAARIRGRLRRLGVRRRHWTQTAARPVSGWHSLTDIERVASELVAQGLNNQQVADQMYISVHTVAFHMRHIFRKLAIGSRVELARIVLQQAPQPRHG